MGGLIKGLHVALGKQEADFWWSLCLVPMIVLFGHCNQ